MSQDVDATVERRYELVTKLGKGAYGIVWRAIDRKTRKGVALKKMFDVFTNATDAQRTYREILFLLQLSHDNIVKLLNVLPAENGIDIYVVFELMETDLHAAIRCGALQDVHKQFITYQLLRCIRHLHALDILHRDLKPANILINSDCHVKLADFGLARCIHELSVAKRANKRGQIRPILTDYIATRWYRPPEVVFGCTEYTKAVDMWGVGCIVAEMLLGKPLFPGTSTLDQLQRIIGAIGAPSSEDIASMQSGFADDLLESCGTIVAKPLRTTLAAQSREAIDLVCKLLAFNPAKRLTAVDAMRHPYLAPFVCDADMLPDPPSPPMVLPIPDSDRLTEREYRAAIYDEVVKRKKDHRRKKSMRKGSMTNLTEAPTCVLAPEESLVRKPE